MSKNHVKGTQNEAIKMAKTLVLVLEIETKPTLRRQAYLSLDVYNSVTYK